MSGFVGRRDEWLGPVASAIESGAQPCAENEHERTGSEHDGSRSVYCTRSICQGVAVGALGQPARASITAVRVGSLDTPAHGLSP